MSEATRAAGSGSATSRYSVAAPPPPPTASLLGPIQPDRAPRPQLDADAKGAVLAWALEENARTGRFPTAKEVVAHFPGYLSESAANTSPCEAVRQALGSRERVR